jgi:hypothetical protein
MGADKGNVKPDICPSPGVWKKKDVVFEETKEMYEMLEIKLKYL